MTILFGHAVADPFDLAADLHQYALQNLAAALAIAALAGPVAAGDSRRAAETSEGG